MEAILQLDQVVKEYKDKKAVDHVSFSVPRGKIFGLLGPNGAGKTSIIRIITNITRADSGTVLFNGEVLKRRHIERIGYLPEERGLYKKMKVGEQLMYLSQIKGMSRTEARAALKDLLTRFEMQDWQGKKIEELSKGMQQKVQFVATVVHSPQLIILDEPFTGLDPINTNLIKDEIHKMVDQGTTVIFSTHRMEQVEEICERIVLINAGKNILDGAVDDIKSTYKDNVFELRFESEAPEVVSDEVVVANWVNNGSTMIKAKEHLNPSAVLSHLMNRYGGIVQFREELPSLNEIFIKQVNR